MSLSGDLTDSFMKTGSNGNRLSPIPIGIAENDFVTAIKTMENRLDLLLTLEANQDHNKSTQVMMQELSLAEAVNVLGGRLAITGATLTIKANQETNERDKENAEIARFNNMLNDLRNQHQDALQRARDNEDKLKEKFSTDDVLATLTALYLTPEERASLQTDAEMRTALLNKYLDENGNLKPEHKTLIRTLPKCSKAGGTLKELMKN